MLLVVACPVSSSVLIFMVREYKMPFFTQHLHEADIPIVTDGDSTELQKMNYDLHAAYFKIDWTMDELFQ